MLSVRRQEGHLACKELEWWDAGVVICLERGAQLHMVQLMPPPLSVSCFSKIPDRLYLCGTSSPVSPGRRAVKQLCVCVLRVQRQGM